MLRFRDMSVSDKRNSDTYNGPVSGRHSTRSASGWSPTSGAALLLVSIPSLLLGACLPGGASDSVVVLDGSSTVFPLAEALAEEFQNQHHEHRVTVGVSGSGGGFQRFCDGLIDIASASREITPAEASRCRANEVAFEAFPLARDGVTLVVHPANSSPDARALTR